MNQAMAATPDKSISSLVMSSYIAALPYLLFSFGFLVILLGLMFRADWAFENALALRFWISLEIIALFSTPVFLGCCIDEKLTIAQRKISLLILLGIMIIIALLMSHKIKGDLICGIQFILFLCAKWVSFLYRLPSEKIVKEIGYLWIISFLCLFVAAVGTAIITYSVKLVGMDHLANQFNQLEYRHVPLGICYFLGLAVTSFIFKQYRKNENQLVEKLNSEK
ncbi:hypothetical protein ACFL54_05500 [Planctomycetota bacterium]